MQNRYPLWKYIILLAITVLGFLYSAPNLFGEDPSVQISPNSTEVSLDTALVDQVKDILVSNNLKYQKIEQEPKNLLIRFYNTDT